MAEANLATLMSKRTILLRVSGEAGNVMNEAPFFSIGVTTYNRHELLKQTLMSITGQTFPDFEVIVGNDYTQETLSAELLGIEDARIRFVNYPKNLGETGNLNSLLGMSRGRYFTMLSDDDLYTPNFLEAVHSVLVKFGFPPCAFTSYETIRGTSFPDLAKIFSWEGRLFAGRQFLRMYLSGKLKAMGCTGVYDTEYLRRIGGVERLCDGPIALHSEYALLVGCGLLEKIAYVDAPLVLFRSSGQSYTWQLLSLDDWMHAGESLICKSIEVFSMPNLKKDFRQNFASILRLSVGYLVVKASKSMSVREVMAYLFSLKRLINPLRGTAAYWKALVGLGQVLGQAGVRLIWIGAREKFKSTAPPSLVKLVYLLFRNKTYPLN